MISRDEGRKPLQSTIARSVDNEFSQLIKQKVISDTEVGTIRNVLQKIARMDNLGIASLWYNKLLDVDKITLDRFMEHLDLLDQIKFENDEKISDDEKEQFFKVAQWIVDLKNPFGRKLTGSAIELDIAKRTALLKVVNSIINSAIKACKVYETSDKEKAEMETFERRLNSPPLIAIPWYIRKNTSNPQSLEILNERLIYFSKYGYPEQVEELIKHGADPHYRSKPDSLSAVEYAIIGYDHPTFEAFIKCGVKPDEKLFELAVKFNKPQAVKLLIENNADLSKLNTQNAIPPELTENNMQFLISDDVNEQRKAARLREKALHAAIKDNNINGFIAILSNGAAQNIGNIAIALLKYGANLNNSLVKQFVTAPDNARLIHMLLLKGAKPDGWSSSVFGKYRRPSASTHLNYLLKRHPLEELPYHLTKFSYPELIKSLIEQAVQKKQVTVLDAIFKDCSQEKLAFLKKDFGLVKKIIACVKEDVLISPKTKLGLLDKLQLHVHSTQGKLVAAAKNDIKTPPKPRYSFALFRTAQSSNIRLQLLRAVKENDLNKIRSITSSSKKNCNIKDDDGRTLLDIYYTHIRNAKSPESKDPLVWVNDERKSSLPDDLKIFSYLLTKLDINDRTEHNQTLLHIAAKTKAPVNDFILFLLVNKANPNLIDADGKKPVDYLTDDMRDQKQLLTEGISCLFIAENRTLLSDYVKTFNREGVDDAVRQDFHGYLKDAINHSIITKREQTAALRIIGSLIKPVNIHAQSLRL